MKDDIKYFLKDKQYVTAGLHVMLFLVLLPFVLVAWLIGKILSKII